MTNVKEIGTCSAQNRAENQSICIFSLFPDLFQIKNNLGSAQPLLRKRKVEVKPMGSFHFECQEPDVLAVRVKTLGSVLGLLWRRHTCCVKEKMRASCLTFIIT